MLVLFVLLEAIVLVVISHRVQVGHTNLQLVQYHVRNVHLAIIVQLELYLPQFVQMGQYLQLDSRLLVDVCHVQ